MRGGLCRVGGWRGAIQDSGTWPSSSRHHVHRHPMGQNSVVCPAASQGRLGKCVTARPGGQEPEFGEFTALSLHHSGQPAVIPVAWASWMFSDIPGFYPLDASSAPQI